MCTALRAKKKYGFIDGSVKQPADDSLELEDWWTINSMLISWVFNTIEPTLRSTISHIENVKDLWEDIKQRFSIGNGPRMQQLRSDLANCRQEGQLIVSYFGRLKTLWDEINNYDQIPVCICAGCRCNLTIKLERKREEERVHQFLMGLDEEGYGTVRSNILSTEPLPNLNHAYAMVVQQERMRTMTRTKEERGNPMSFAIRAGSRNSGGGGKDKSSIYSNCNREGHDAESCFQLIGYPEWWGNRPRRTSVGRGGGQKRGNRVGRSKGEVARANATQAIGVDGGRGIVTDSDRKGLSRLNKEQWAALLGMLNSCQNGGNETLTGTQRIFPWIIDTGASHHMTGTLAFLSELRDIVPCSIGLPNGEKTLAVKEGTVLLGGDLKLQQVLYMPNLNCNLIFVSQLLNDSNLVIQLTNKICAIQDLNSRNLIGAGEQLVGLYFLKGFTSVHACKTSCVGILQQNDRVERKHRHILYVARALRFQVNLPIEFWGECVLVAGYLINRTPSILLNGKIPYEMFFGKVPSYKHVRVFGCLCYAHNLNRDKDKFSSRSRRCVFVGYSFEKKGWRLYDLETKEYFVSRDVVFAETEFPYANEKTMGDELIKNGVEELGDEVDGLENNLGKEHDESVGRESEVNPKTEELIHENSEGVDRGEVIEEQLGRRQRAKQPSVRLKDYVTNAIKISPSVCSPSQSDSLSTPYSIAHYVDYDKFSAQH
ncbi:uncharacterized protein LOC131169439 [Hevea brasiliensis]|uniref:uncharacterized protein LOC131169439 n=1 Tax=Hevea brasiliensis TaxID=3981 RepID=UPI0025F5A6BC|nr:uncharacterized protein LOC131169439 [Hevea brasiliensis]